MIKQTLKYCLVMIVIITASIFSNSIIGSAEKSDSTNLYKLLNPIELNDNIQIEQGTLVYGTINESSQVGVFYNGKEYLFEIDNFEVVSEENLETIPNYIDLLTKNTVEEEVSTDIQFIDLETNQITEKVKVKQSHVSSLYIEDGNKNIVIGNIAYKVESIKISPESEMNNVGDTSQTESNNVVEDKPKNKVQRQTLSTVALDTNNASNIWETSNAQYFKVLDIAIPVYESKNGSLVKVGEVKKDQVYPRIGVLNNWHMIQFGNTKGYVWNKSTVPANKSDIPNFNKEYSSINKYFTAKQHVVVYDNSSGSMVAMGAISEGERYPIVSDTGNWIKVIFGDRIGYVYKEWIRFDFTSSDKYFKVLDIAIPVYESKNGSLVKVGEVKKDQVYPRIGVLNNWHMIQFGNTKGYVWSQSTEPATQSEIPNLNKSYSNSARHLITNQHVVVYDNSNGTMEMMGAISEGERYPVVSDAGNWIKVIFGDRIGYVYKNWVSLEFLDSDKAFKADVSHIPVYFNHTGEMVKAGHLIKDQIYIISGRSGNWHRIDYGSNYGYVWIKSTSPASTSSVNNLKTDQQDSNTSVLALNGIVVYDTSKGGLEPFARIEEGTVFPLVTDTKFGSWYQVIIAGRIGYTHVNGVTAQKTSYTQYDLTLAQALEMQMKVNPTTTNEYRTYVSKDWINSSNKVTADVLNVRGGPSANDWIVGKLSKGNSVTILGQVGNWYEIEYTKYYQDVGASPSDTKKYLDPNTFVNDDIQKFQFLDLSKSSNVSAGVLNTFLKGKGTLNGQAQAFIDASRIHGVNDIYLVSHAILETGHGTSSLASGIQVGKNSAGNPVLVNSKNKNSLTQIKTVYNMFGIHAFNHAPNEEGAKKAYIEGWDTPYKAIVGGAAFIGNNYIKAGQNTLYKMRWNPESMDDNNYASHQYATDIGWASKQVYSIFNLYKEIDNYVLYLDVPKYK